MCWGEGGGGTEGSPIMDAEMWLLNWIGGQLAHLWSVGPARISFKPRIAAVRQLCATVPCAASDEFWVISVTLSLVSRTLITTSLASARVCAVSTNLS